MPNQVDDALLHAMSGSELSRVRTETDQLRIVPTVAPHPVQTNSEFPGHCRRTNVSIKIPRIRSQRIERTGLELRGSAAATGIWARNILSLSSSKEFLRKCVVAATNNMESPNNSQNTQREKQVERMSSHR